MRYTLLPAPCYNIIVLDTDFVFGACIVQAYKYVSFLCSTIQWTLDTERRNVLYNLVLVTDHDEIHTF